MYSYSFLLLFKYPELVTTDSTLLQLSVEGQLCALLWPRQERCPRWVSSSIECLNTHLS